MAKCFYVCGMVTWQFLELIEVGLRQHGTEAINDMVVGVKMGWGITIR